jgi:hypothetical protein
MNEKLPILNIIENLLGIHKKDKANFQEISNIFMSLSEMCKDEPVRSFCIDASVVVVEAVYGKPVAMSFEELEEEFKKLGK